MRDHAGRDDLVSNPVRVVPAEALTTPEGIAGIGREPVPGSLLERLRRHAAEARETRTIDKAVPGPWRGELLLRFKPLDMGQLERFADARNRGRTSQISEGIDAMTSCCIGVFARDGDRLIELADASGPVRIEHRLGVLLGMPIPDGATLTAREVTVNLFAGNAFALGNFVDELVSWMNDPDAPQASPGER
jgi:hypothetical protein